MRIVIATIVVIALPVLAAAQSKGSHRGSSAGHTTPPPFWSSMTSTLPPIGLPLAPIGLAPPSRPPFNGRFDGRFDRRPRFDSRKNGFGNVVYVVPPFYADIFAPYPGVYLPSLSSPVPGTVVSPEPAAPPASPLPAAPPSPANGLLRLELEGVGPTPQVFVDGYFFGTLGDLNGQLFLEAGPHQIGVKAPGFKPLGFDVKIVADRPITYRGTFERADGSPGATLPSPSSFAPSTIYFIPGCYLGNVAPVQAALPATCDITKLSSYKP